MIKSLQHKYPIKLLCQKLNISRSSYYKWLHQLPTTRDITNRVLKNDIVNIYKKYDGIYGYRRIYLYIRLRMKKSVNHKRIYRLMKSLGLKAMIRRKKKRYVPSIPKIKAENLLNREFNESKGNKKWLTDVTEFKLKTGNKVYLSAIYDLGSNKIISHEISTSNNNELVFNTFKKAIKNNNTKGIIMHNDRGYQYTSRQFKYMLDQREMIQSMSRPGHCIDNGPMEGVWGTIKSELFKGNKKFKFESFDIARRELNNYIEFFNKERISLKMATLIS